MKFQTKRIAGVIGLVALAVVLGYSHFSQKEDVLLPALLQGLPVDFDEAQEQLQTRLNKAIPLPVPEQDLTTLLSQQGFAVSLESQNARFSNSGIACDYIWDIRWDSQSEVVTRVKAVVGAICV